MGIFRNPHNLRAVRNHPYNLTAVINHPYLYLTVVLNHPRAVLNHLYNLHQMADTRWQKQVPEAADTELFGEPCTEINK